MSLFENKIRKMIFFNRKDKDIYIHSLKDIRTFEIDENKMGIIRSYNRTYHVLWASFVSCGTFFYELIKNLDHMWLYAVLYIIGVLWFLEIYYSIRVYRLIANNRKLKIKIGINEIRERLKPSFRGMVGFAFVVMSGIYFFYALKQNLVNRNMWDALNIYNVIVLNISFNIVYYSFISWALEKFSPKKKTKIS